MLIISTAFQTDSVNRPADSTSVKNNPSPCAEAVMQVSPAMTAIIRHIAAHENDLSPEEIRHQLKTLSFTEKFSSLSTATNTIELKTAEDHGYQSQTSSCSSRVSSAPNTPDVKAGPCPELPDVKPSSPKLNRQGSLFAGMPRIVGATQPEWMNKPVLKDLREMSTPLESKLNAQGTFYQGMPRHKQFQPKTVAREVGTAVKSHGSNMPAIKLNRQGTFFQGLKPAGTGAQTIKDTGGNPQSVASSQRIRPYIPLNTQGNQFQGLPHVNDGEPLFPQADVSNPLLGNKQKAKTYIPLNLQGTQFQGLSKIDDSWDDNLYHHDEYADDTFDAEHLNEVHFDDHDIWSHLKNN